jgi:hypothetical protein
LAKTDIPSIRSKVKESLRALMTMTAGPIEMVTSLAEGADRLAAEEGLRLGYGLTCPLPFDRVLYEADFTDEASVIEFRALLRQARSIEELPGSRETIETDQRAYAAAGYRVVELSDIILTVWNGKRARGSGGTGHIVSAARSRGIPVIWVPTRPDTEVTLITPEKPMSCALVAALEKAFPLSG